MRQDMRQDPVNESQVYELAKLIMITSQQGIDGVAAFLCGYFGVPARCLHRGPRDGSRCRSCDAEVTEP